MAATVPKPCRIFRIVHFDNLAGIIEQGGMRCGIEMAQRELPYKQIGLVALNRDMDRRAHLAPGLKAY